jgi:Phosphoribulokinase / Uridine kinase family
MAERGHSLESIKASIEARKPDFDAFIGIVSLKVYNKYTSLILS